MNSELRIYKGKKVLVTGNTGFKGSWICLWLNELGAKVSGYALNPPTKPSLFAIVKLKDSISHHTGDIRDFDKLKKVIKETKPDIIIHMAAQPLVRRSYLEPKYTYEVNVLGTVNVLEAIRQSGTVKALINITSDKCYENREWHRGYKETDPMGGYDPYSSSKGCSELVTAAYTKSFFNPEQYKKHGVAVASVRAGNIIGGGDWAEDRLVPDCMKTLARGETIIIRSPQAIRPWQYMLDPLYGYLLLGARLLKGKSEYIGPWNFGPADKNIIDVETLVQYIVKFWGEGSYSAVSNSKFHEARLLKLDINKSVNLLKWHPIMNIQTALKETAEWYRKYYIEKADMRAESINEIREYFCKQI
jgi:CDP-glucose 4,6-dehydratase